MSLFFPDSWASGGYMRSNGTVAYFFCFVFCFRSSLIRGRIPVPLSMFEGQQQYRKYRKNDILFSPSYNTVEGQGILKLKRNKLFPIQVFFFSRNYDANGAT